MRKNFRIILYSFYSILCLILCVILFLFIFYSVLERKQNNQKKKLEANSNVITNSGKTSTPPNEGKVLNLIPVPQKVQFTNGCYTFPSTLVYYIADSAKATVAEYLTMLSGINAIFSTSGRRFLFRLNSKLPAQGYKLDIQHGKIIVDYGDNQGLYYAIVTLKVLKQNYNGKIPCGVMEDFPDLAIRGLMLDISRDKVPKLQTLLDIVQIMADLKYNHLELYIEGFSFAYPSFKDFWSKSETPITGEEIKILDAFCKAHFIDLVPNQNTFGHMMAWIATKEYGDLAECPDGYKVMGLMNMKGTLDPNDPRSIELISKMSDDLLPNFTSSSYNVNLDEPLELGQGKSKKLVKELGEVEVYLQYMLKVHKMVTERNKKMMVWGDIVMKHPELLSRIPKDITILDWGYESSYPFERHSRTLQSSGLNYLVCPGTNSWASIAGRTNNMLQTIASAALNGAKYGAKGILITDWGDLGNWQYLPVSFAGYTAGASLGWNSSRTSDIPLSEFLNSYIFRDNNSVMGNLVLDLGRYSSFEEIPVVNMTTTFMSFQIGLRDRLVIDAIYSVMNKSVFKVMDDIAPEMSDYYKNKHKNRHPFDYDGLYHFLEVKESTLADVKLKTKDSLIVKDEYRNAIRLIKAGVTLQHYIENRNHLSIAQEKSNLISIRKSCLKYLDENQRLWNLRNKPGGYDRSIASIKTLIKQIDDRLTILDKSFFGRAVYRFLEKMETAGLVLILKAA